MRRDNVIVSLEGHGGDELLGGYGLHILLALLRGPSFIRAPRRIFDLIDTLQHMYSAQDPRTTRQQGQACCPYHSANPHAVARRLFFAQSARAQ